MVSIIIPLYNSEKYIKDTIISCINQTYKEIEIIVLNDCSTDNSIDIVSSYAAKDIRIKLISNKKNMGLIYTLNKGIEISKGDYILVLGNDDVLEKNHIEIMLTALIQSKASFAYCSSYYIDGEGERIGYSETMDYELNKLLMGKKNIINSCGLLMDKDILEKVGGYPEQLGFRYYGEWYLWIEMASINSPKYVDTISSNYRIHDSNLTKTFMNSENLKLTKKYNLACMKLAYKSLGYSILEKMLLIISRWIYQLKMIYHIYFLRRK